MKRTLWTGRVLSGAAVLFLLFDSVIKVMKLPLAVEATVQLGYPDNVVVGIGLSNLSALSFMWFRGRQFLARSC